MERRKRKRSSHSLGYARPHLPLVSGDRARPPICSQKGMSQLGRWEMEPVSHPCRPVAFFSLLSPAVSSAHEQVPEDCQKANLGSSSPPTAQDSRAQLPRGTPTTRRDLRGAIWQVLWKRRNDAGPDGYVMADRLSLGARCLSPSLTPTFLCCLFFIRCASCLLGAVAARVPVARARYS